MPVPTRRPNGPVVAKWSSLPHRFSHLEDAARVVAWLDTQAVPVAAPIAAYIVRILPTRIMGTAVGGFILVVNANTFFGAVGLPSSLTTVAFVAIIAIWVAALIFAIGARRQEQEEAPEGQAV